VLEEEGSRGEGQNCSISIADCSACFALLLLWSFFPKEKSENRQLVMLE
jgi:hypothetical protein